MLEDMRWVGTVGIVEKTGLIDVAAIVRQAATGDRLYIYKFYYHQICPKNYLKSPRGFQSGCNLWVVEGRWVNV